MSEPQTTDSTTDVMRYWVGLLRQLGEDVCSWMAVVEAMQRRIAELEAMLGRITTTNRELLDESDRDRAVIEAARAYLTSYVANEPITGYKMATQRADLFHAIRLHDEKENGHE